MDKITVQYRNRRVVCACCHQMLSEPKVSEELEFTFSKRNMLDYAPWEEIVEDNEELDEMVEEFVHETIHFFAMSMDDNLVIEPSEIARVKQFILDNVNS